jgi:hypothetical protein
MAGCSSSPRLSDILEAIELINAEMAGIDLAAFEADKRKRWLVERGIEIISEASRNLDDDIKARRPGIAWPKMGSPLVPDEVHPAAGLAAVKDEPSGRPGIRAFLDSHSTRRPSRCVGRDERMGSAGGHEQKDCAPG